MAPFDKYEGTLLGSTVRAASTSSAAQHNADARGVMVILDVTVAPAETLTLAIEKYIPTSDTWEALTNFGATASGYTGEKVYILYPGATETTAITDQELAGIPLPLGKWRVTVTHSAGSDWTYSVSYAYCA